MSKADNLPSSCAVVMKSGNPNFLEPSAPVQACNGIALPLPLVIQQQTDFICYVSSVVAVSPQFPPRFHNVSYSDPQFYQIQCIQRLIARGWQQIAISF